MHDYIIVGNGLAGVVLSYRLNEEGKSIVIVDEDAPEAAWKVAGGVWNAISFKRIIKGWMADEMTDEADAFYQKLQDQWKIEFYEAKKIVRIFSDVHFQNTWLSKSDSPELTSFLSDNSPNELETLPLKMPFGAGTVKKGGHVQLGVFMKAIKAHLNKSATLINEKFDFDSLTVNDEHVEYKEIKARNIVFCEGYEVINNPFFSWLPMSLTKGEILILKNPGWKFDCIINNGKHLIDLKDGRLGVGATFDWKNLDHSITEEGKEQLLDHLEKNFEFRDWKVLIQKAGIRPTVADRRPLTGVHPDHPNVFVFNGLGTKGVLIAPWMAKKMVQYLVHGTALPDESNIQRFAKKHFR